MKRSRSFAAAVLAGLMLAGCSVGSPVPAASSTIIPPKVPLSDEIFLEVLRKDWPADSEITDQDILDVIDAACGALSRGATGKEIQAGMIEMGEKLSTIDAELRLIKVGVFNYCPEYLAEFDFVAPVR